MRRLLLAVLLLVACEGPRASVEIEDLRVTRDEGNRAVAEVDLLAHDQLGDNVGHYCVRIAFPAELPVVQCDADLEDGDRRTFRFVSFGVPRAGDAVDARVRLGASEVGRSHAIP